MSVKRDREVRKLSNRSVWPSIIKCLLLIIISVIAIFMLVEESFRYITSKQLSDDRTRAVQISDYLNKQIFSGFPLDDAADNLLAIYSDLEGLAIEDRNGNRVYSYNAEGLDADRIIRIDIPVVYERKTTTVSYAKIRDEIEQIYEEEYPIVPNAVSEIVIFNDDGEFDMSYIGIIPKFAGYLDEGYMLSKLAPKTAGRYDYWNIANTEFGGYRVYTRDSVIFTFRDIYYISIVSLVAALLGLIPLLLFVSHVVSAGRAGKKMRALLALDVVTSGKNRIYFENEAGRRLHRACKKRSAGKGPRFYAVVDLEMKRFPLYCATYGAKEGENLLERINEFLVEKIGRGGIAARYDEADFALLTGTDGVEECTAFVKELMEGMNDIVENRKTAFRAGIRFITTPCVADNGGVIPNADTAGDGQETGKEILPVIEPVSETEACFTDRKNILVYILPRDRHAKIDIANLRNDASGARLETDNSAENAIMFYDRKLIDALIWEERVIAGLDEAIANEEFEVYFQPKYHPATEELLGAEALIRWNSPKDGFISPGRFIPVLEKTGLITKIDDYMLTHVAKKQAEWKNEGYEIVPVSVNVSRTHFADPGLAGHICEMVDRFGLDHKYIEIELTESAFFDDKERLIDTVTLLQRYGFEVSMDDFGSGYSSLNSLKDLPLNVLKLDAEFFNGGRYDCEDAERGYIVVGEAIRLAKSLNMRTVAEGIEERDQVEILADMGCDMIQGFYFAKPMPFGDYENRMKKTEDVQ